jgi:hypothetical protein
MTPRWPIRLKAVKPRPESWMKNLKDGLRNSKHEGDLSLKSMIRDKVSKEFNIEVKADKNHAQILIEVNSGINTLNKARKIIEGLGIHIIETKRRSSKLVPLKLDIKDMREVVLKLTESGFFQH